MPQTYSKHISCIDITSMPKFSLLCSSVVLRYLILFFACLHFPHHKRQLSLSRIRCVKLVNGYISVTAIQHILFIDGSLTIFDRAHIQSTCFSYSLMLLTHTHITHMYVKPTKSQLDDNNTNLYEKGTDSIRRTNRSPFYAWKGLN